MDTRHAAALALGTLLCGCAGFRPVGRDVVGGALDELERRGGTAALTREAVAGARDELAGAESREKLKALQAAMMEQMTLDAARLRQELLGEAFRADVERARAEFLDNSRLDLQRMRNELLGPRTRDAAGALADRVTGEITRENLARLRDEVLGERSRLLTQQLVQQAGHSMQHEMDVMRARLEGEKDALKGDLQWTLWLSGSFIAALGVAVAGLAAAARRKNRIIDALAGPIQEIADGRTYEDLTRRIARRARELGVSGLLPSRFTEREPEDGAPPASGAGGG